MIWVHPCQQRSFHASYAGAAAGTEVDVQDHQPDDEAMGEMSVD